MSRAAPHGSTQILWNSRLGGHDQQIAAACTLGAALSEVVGWHLVAFVDFDGTGPTFCCGS